MGDEVQQKFETLQLHAGYVRHTPMQERNTVANHNQPIGKNQTQQRTRAPFQYTLPP